MDSPTIREGIARDRRRLWSAIDMLTVRGVQRYSHMMLTALRLGLCVELIVLATSFSISAASYDASTDRGQDRTFLFTYATKVTGLKPGQIARVWIPVPQDAATQKVEIVEPVMDGAVLGSDQ